MEIPLLLGRSALITLNSFMFSLALPYILMGLWLLFLSWRLLKQKQLGVALTDILPYLAFIIALFFWLGSYSPQFSPTNPFVLIYGALFLGCELFAMADVKHLYWLNGIQFYHQLKLYDELAEKLRKKLFVMAKPPASLYFPYNGWIRLNGLTAEEEAKILTELHEGLGSQATWQVSRWHRFLKVQLILCWILLLAHFIYKFH